MMKIYALLFFVVSCMGIQWKEINYFKDAFKKYSLAGDKSISSINTTLDTSISDLDLFLKRIYLDDPIIKGTTELRSPNDKCFSRFIDKNKMNVFLQIQINQLQSPLRRRILEITNRLSRINSSISSYGSMAKGIFQSCKSSDRICYEKTNEWLKSNINSMYCEIYPKCRNINIKKENFPRKTSIFDSLHFSCEVDKCIAGNWFCDGECHCANCCDEPPDCVKHCPKFRCSDDFSCIPNSRRCDGVVDCEDGTEEGCQTATALILSDQNINCSIDAGMFLCGNKKCISLGQVCDDHDDCGDGSDESEYCKEGKCSPQCDKRGGVCIFGQGGSECLNECPQGTYETSKGCKLKPDPPNTNLMELLHDTQRLATRYVGRLNRLKTNIIMTIYNSVEDVLYCKTRDIHLLSKLLYPAKYGIVFEPEANNTRQPITDSKNMLPNEKNMILSTENRKLPSKTVENGTIKISFRQIDNGNIKPTNESHEKAITEGNTEGNIPQNANRNRKQVEDDNLAKSQAGSIPDSDPNGKGVNLAISTLTKTNLTTTSTTNHTTSTTPKNRAMNITVKVTTTTKARKKTMGKRPVKRRCRKRCRKSGRFLMVRSFHGRSFLS